MTALPRKPFLRQGRWQGFAHRGDRRNHPPGNRWSALQSAVAAGFDHIETDVHLSADGQLVLFHDDRLDDETNGSGAVGDHPWSELAALRYVVDGTVLDEGLVRLEDAIERWPHVAWNVDAKSEDAVQPLVDLIERHAAFERVLVTSFSYRTVRRLRSLVPARVSTGLSGPEIALLRGASLVRLPIPRLGDAAQVPERKGPITIVDRRFVTTCHEAGIAVHVWTVNDKGDMHRLLDLGVDAIITDDPSGLREVLIERGAWSADDQIDSGPVADVD